MNYKNHYKLLVNRAKSRILEGYCESHHIIPKCLGGSNEPSNLVNLTAEEHFLAHQLLVKIYPDNTKLALAVSMMCIKNPKHQRNNKMYGWLRRAFSEAQKTKIRKVRAKETKPRKKRILSEEHKLKISSSGKGRIVLPETRELLSIKLKGKPCSEETKLKIGAASKKRKHSAESKQKISSASTGRIFSYNLVTCPHCGKSGKGGNMTRYHFDKCLLKKPFHTLAS